MNKSEREDRRIKRTRKQLKEALLALILKNGYDAITIQDITEQADLGRTTFYLHYKDKKHLLTECMDTIADELICRLETIQPQANKLQAATLIIFQHARENADLYRIILSGQGAIPTTNHVKKIITDKFEQALQAFLQGASLSPPIPFIANYFSSSIIGLIVWWLENDVSYSPEEMSEMFLKLFLQGTASVLQSPLTPPS